jgi:uncharacterized membrane protein YdjX (TVP38/TMEM64 family)
MDTLIQDWLETCSRNPILYSIASFILLILDLFIAIPSSIILYTNGLVLGWWPGFFVSFLACMASAWIGYQVGYRGFHLPPDADVISRSIKHNRWIIVLSRGIPLACETLSVLSGYYQVPQKQFLWLNALGFMPLCFIYSYLGSVGQGQDLITWGLGLAMGFSAILWLLGRKKFIPQENEESGKSR